jgi:hypothetical protein
MNGSTRVLIWVGSPLCDDRSGNLSLSTLYYAEYNNTGPGLDKAGRVTLLGYHVINNVVNATVFTVSNFLLGGDPIV